MKTFSRLLFFLCLFFGLKTTQAQIKLDSLVIHYNLNGHADDSSGNTLNGVAMNLVDTNDRFGNANSAMYFNGTSGFIFLPNDSRTKPPFPFALSLWIRIDAYPTLHQIVYKSDEDNSTYSGFWLTLNPQGQLAAGIGNGLSVNINNRKTRLSNGAISLNTWHHVVASYQSPTSIEIFVDGVLQTGAYSGYASSFGYSNVAGTIGRYITGSSGTRYIEAEIDDLRLYNDALTQHDVNYLNFEYPCTKTLYDSISVIDTIAFNQTVYDTITSFDTIPVNVQVTQYDTIAIANTLLIYSSINIEEQIAELFKIYPNPTSDFVMVDLGEIEMKLEGKSIEILNSLGQKVKEVPVENKKTRIELSSSTTEGVYYIQLKNELGQSLITKKLIVQ